jgi:hypothetical protein
MAGADQYSRGRGDRVVVPFAGAVVGRAVI